MHSPRLGAFRRDFSRGLTLALTVLAFIAALTAAPAAAHAADIHVDVTRGSDFAGDGSIGRPYKTITRGLSVASYGDTVRAAAGEYSPLSGEILPLTVPVGVTLQGDTTRVFHVQGLWGTVVKGNDTSRLLQIVNGNENTIVDGIYFTDNESPHNGGAVFIDGGSLPGGGPIVRDCTIFLVQAPHGGGIFVDGTGATICRPRIERTFVLGARAVAANGRGGGLCAGEADVTITDSYFVSCTLAVNSFGGGIYLDGPGDSEINRSYIIGCGGPAGATGAGGGIYAYQTDLRMTQCSVDSCGCDWGAGLFFWATGGESLYLENSLFTENIATALGGAARVGGPATSLVRNCTLLDNSVTGGGVGGLAPYQGTHTIVNSILWGNGDDISATGGATLALLYSCVEDLDVGVSVIHNDPMFTAAGAFPRLAPGSPCVDAGTNTGAPSMDYEGRSRPADGDGDGTAVVDIGATERNIIVDSSAGANRYETAIAASEEHFDRADTVVLATGAAYPDALCAAPLAGAARAPVLLTPPTALAIGLAEELERLEAEKVYIAGGSGAVSEGVADDLRDLGYEVERLAGADKYATSRAIAEELSDILGAALPATVVVARGDAYPDALSASPFAWLEATPILLTRPHTLPAPTAAVITNLGFVEAIVVGGEGAVSAEVLDEVDALLAGGAVRVAGADRYATAAAFAGHVHDTPAWSGLYVESYVGLATGTNFPDALCGGAACGAERAPLLLTRQDRLPSPTREYISDFADEIYDVHAFGGTAVVSDAVLAEARGLIP